MSQNRLQQSEAGKSDLSYLMMSAAESNGLQRSAQMKKTNERLAKLE